MNLGALLSIFLCSYMVPLFAYVQEESPDRQLRGDCVVLGDLGGVCHTIDKAHQSRYSTIFREAKEAQEGICFA